MAAHLDVTSGISASSAVGFRTSPAARHHQLPFDRIRLLGSRGPARGSRQAGGGGPSVGLSSRPLLLYELRPSQWKLPVPLFIFQPGPAVLGSNGCLCGSLTACWLLYFEKRPCRSGHGRRGDLTCVLLSPLLPVFLLTVREHCLAAMRLRGLQTFNGNVPHLYLSFGEHSDACRSSSWLLLILPHRIKDP